jgi:hypothetical protein
MELPTPRTLAPNERKRGNMESGFATRFSRTLPQNESQGGVIQEAFSRKKAQKSQKREEAPPINENPKWQESIDCLN